MNPALWRKAVSDAWRQLVICAVILLLFSWLFVWLMSLLEVGAWAILLNMVPSVFKTLIGVDVAKLATPTGQLSLLYFHTVTLLVCVGWALGRGSDAIAGEIGRGTMDLVLSLPIRRATVVVTSAVVAAFGAAVLPLSVLAGTCLGLATVTLHGEVSPWALLPGVINLACMTFCFAGITTFISAFNRDRWRTIILSGGFFVVSLIVKMAWRLVPDRLWLKEWLHYASFLTSFRPQYLILEGDDGSLALQYNATLVILGLATYVAAAVVLTYRDIPTAR